MRSGARAAGARALRPARVVALRRPGGRRTGRPPGSPSGRLPAGSTSAGRPARFQAAVHGAQRALAVTLARNDRSCHGRAGSGGPVVTGREQHVDVVEEADHPLAEPLAPCAAGPAPPGGPAGRSGRACGCAAAARARSRPQVLGVVLGAGHPAGHRAGGGAGGDRRVLPHDGVPGRRRAAATTASTAARAAASARTPGTGERVETRDPQRPARRGRRRRLLPGQHGVRDGEVGHRRRQRAVLGHARPAVGADLGRDDAAPGLERDQPAGRGREAQRAHAVVAVGQRHAAGGDRGGAAAGAAAPASGRCPTGCGSPCPARRWRRRGRARARG